MRTILSIAALALLTTNAYAQTETKYPKEVKINWDTKVFEAQVPVDEPFILVVYSQNQIPDLVLMRYIERKVFYYYEQPIQPLANSAATNTITKKTEKTTTKGSEVTKEVNIEYNIDPVTNYPFTQKYSITPLRANFYYSLLAKSTYEASKESEDKNIDTQGLNAKKDEGAITNTYLSYTDNNKRRVTAIIGVSYFKAETKIVRPYLGLRYNFIPINRDIQSRYYEEMHFQGTSFARVANKFSLDIGISLATIKDSVHNQYDLFGKNNILTGLGFRIGDGFFYIYGGDVVQ